MRGIQRDMQRQKGLQATTGVTHPSATKCRALNDPVTRAVAAYGRAARLSAFYCASVAFVDIYWSSLTL